MVQQPSPRAEVTDAVPSAANENQTRRNVACVNCRDSKVRCRPGPAPGQPCQRCSKQHVKCVINRAHKRETRRSKLAQLEDELRSIKRVVNSKASQDGPPASTSASPRATRPVFAEQAAVPEPTLTRRGPSSPTEQEHASERGPAQARTLQGHHVSGEDIDMYFGKYLECFHPFIPVLRKRTPNECYAASQPLFWTIIYIASRRYSRDAALFATLVDDYIANAVWSSAANPAMSLETIHALLLLATWPLPTIRFSTDPSVALVSIALNACMLMGFHTGQGSHGEFMTAARQLQNVTDEEASSTWAACCALAQRTTSSGGRPPLSIQISDVPWKSVLDHQGWADLYAVFDLQQYLARFHTAMTAQVMVHKCASESSVRLWEDEFDILYPVMADGNADFSSFAKLAARLEIQACYFYTLPTSPSPNFQHHVAKIFTTARRLILSAIDLENRCGFIAHMPHWGFRAVFDAGCILLSILHSANAPPQPPTTDNNDDPADADTIARHAYEVVLRCSVCEYDLPNRGGLVMEAYWALRNELPLNEKAPRAWPNRVGAGIAFWALNVFKDRLQEASHSTTRANRALEALRMTRPENLKLNTPMHDQPSPAGADLLQDIDWSKFLDEFDWDGNDGIFLGLS